MHASRPSPGGSAVSSCWDPPIALPCAASPCPARSAFETPLGAMSVDTEPLSLLAGLPQVIISREAHALEHSLEVHLPFLQTVLGKFTLVPLVVGRAIARGGRAGPGPAVGR